VVVGWPCAWSRFAPPWRWCARASSTAAKRSVGSARSDDRALRALDGSAKLQADGDDHPPSTSETSTWPRRRAPRGARRARRVVVGASEHRERHQCREDRVAEAGLRRPRPAGRGLAPLIARSARGSRSARGHRGAHVLAVREGLGDQDADVLVVQRVDALAPARRGHEPRWRSTATAARRPIAPSRPRVQAPHRAGDPRPTG